MYLIHGGDREGYMSQYGHMPVDFSVNCNPLGPPLGVQKAICDSVDTIDVYPDPLCRRLCREISEVTGVDSKKIVCGNGAADMIYRLVQAIRPKRALVIHPTFSEYGLALASVGCEMICHTLRHENGFVLNDAVLDAIDTSLDVAFVCNPNNPTGITADSDLLWKIIEACCRKGVYVIVDECFNGFLESPEDHTVRCGLEKYEKLLVLDAFTKTYGMAGVRLGYCMCGDMALKERLITVSQPWSVSSVAQEAGIRALREKEYIERSRRLIFEEKKFLVNEFERMGLEVIGCEANYIFFRSKVINLRELLCSEGLLIRDCRNYRGLAEGYYRIGVRKHVDNLMLTSTLSEIERKVRESGSHTVHCGRND